MILKLFFVWIVFIVVILALIVVVGLSDLVSSNKEVLVWEGYKSSRPNSLISKL